MGLVTLGRTGNPDITTRLANTEFAAGQRPETLSASRTTLESGTLGALDRFFLQDG